jgi:hypothetical protein
MSVWTDNAAAFASRQESYVDQERHASVRRALDLIRDGRRGYAVFVLTRSVERQARISGVGMADIPACPCGGRNPECRP